MSGSKAVVKTLKVTPAQLSGALAAGRVVVEHDAPGADGADGKFGAGDVSWAHVYHVGEDGTKSRISIDLSGCTMNMPFGVSFGSFEKGKERPYTAAERANVKTKKTVVFNPVSEDARVLLEAIRQLDEACLAFVSERQSIGKPPRKKNAGPYVCPKFYGAVRQDGQGFTANTNMYNRFMKVTEISSEVGSDGRRKLVALSMADVVPPAPENVDEWVAGQPTNNWGGLLRGYDCVQGTLAVDRVWYTTSTGGVRLSIGDMKVVNAGRGSGGEMPEPLDVESLAEIPGPLMLDENGTEAGRVTVSTKPREYQGIEMFPVSLDGKKMVLRLRDTSVTGAGIKFKVDGVGPDRKVLRDRTPRVGITLSEQAFDAIQTLDDVLGSAEHIAENISTFTATAKYKEVPEKETVYRTLYPKVAMYGKPSKLVDAATDEELDYASLLPGEDEEKGGALAWAKVHEAVLLVDHVWTRGDRAGVGINLVSARVELAEAPEGEDAQDAEEIEKLYATAFMD